MEREVVVGHREGLHARPAAEFVKAAAGFRSKVEVGAGGKKVTARSLLGVLSLGVKCGQVVTLTAQGEDAEAALESLARLLHGQA
ncbi:MAG: sugar transporter subunit [Symbiobacteriaceae bacterium]|nr:sugar transporter subunit [Symbiobacteriaceae bacterium]